MAIAFGIAGPRFHNDPAATTLVASYPATVNAGDLLVMHIITNGGAITSPAGWTVAYREGTLANPKGGVWVKIAAGTEGGTTFNITQASTTACGMMWTYTGVDQTTPLDATPSTYSNATAVATVILPSITTVTADALLVYGTGGNSGTSRSVGPAGSTERFDFGHSGGLSTKAGAMYTEPFPTAGATGTRTTNWTDSAGASVTRAGWGVLFALRPAADAAPSAQTVTPTALGLSANEGTPVATTATATGPAGVGLAATEGTPVLSTAATAVPAGIALATNEGSPVVSTAVLVAPAGIGLAAGEGSPAVSTAALASPAGIPLATSAGGPGVSTAALASPAGVPLLAAAGTPTLAAAATVAPSGVGLLAAAGAPAVEQTVPGTNSQPAGVQLAATPGTPTATTAVTARPAGIALAATPAVPVLGSSVRAEPASAGAITQPGTPNLSTGLTAAPTGIVISVLRGTPTRILSFTQTVRPSGHRATASAGTPTAAIYSRIVVGIILTTKRWTAAARADKKAEADSSYTRPKMTTENRWERNHNESR